MAFLVLVAFLVPVIVWRPMDGDEGYYAIATKLVAHGKAPYADFWFQQAPLLPYVYGVFDRAFGSSWYVLRGTSALFTILLGATIAWHGLRRWRSPALAFLAVALFISTPLAFEWFPTVKTYALSTLLLFGAYVAADASSRRGWIAAGVLVGLAIDTRLLFATVIVVFALYAGRQLRAFAAGLAAGLVPLLVSFAAGPARFINDAVMSQTMRSHVRLADNVTQKRLTVGGVLSDAHFAALAMGTLVLFLACLYARRGVPLAVAIALTVGLTNLIPTPTYHQYFVTVVPFLVVSTVDLVARWRPSKLSVAGIALIAVVTGALVPIGIMPASTRGVVAHGRGDLSAVREVSDAIDAHTRTGEPVLSLWPGFVFESHARPMPGVESDFEVEALQDTQLSTPRAHEYHMLSAADITAAIRSHRMRVIVLSRYMGHLGSRRWIAVLQQSGYRPIEDLGFATLWQYLAPSDSHG